MWVGSRPPGRKKRGAGWRRAELWASAGHRISMLEVMQWHKFCLGIMSFRAAANMGNLNRTYVRWALLLKHHILYWPESRYGSSVKSAFSFEWSGVKLGYVHLSSPDTGSWMRNCCMWMMRNYNAIAKRKSPGFCSCVLNQATEHSARDVLDC